MPRNVMGCIFQPTDVTLKHFGTQSARTSLQLVLSAGAAASGHQEEQGTIGIPKYDLFQPKMYCPAPRDAHQPASAPALSTSRSDDCASTLGASVCNLLTVNASKNVPGHVGTLCTSPYGSYEKCTGRVTPEPLALTYSCQRTTVV